MPDRANWAETVTMHPDTLDSPSSVAELRALVAAASKANSEIRAFGGCWSFTDVMATTKRLIDTRSLRGILAFSQGADVWGHTIPGTPNDAIVNESGILPRMLRRGVIDCGVRLAHVLSGTNIREIYLALGSPGGYRDDTGTIVHPGDDRPGRDEWMLATKIGLSGQSIAGAISTGSHGGDFNLPPLVDYVRAIQIIGSGGCVHWIERQHAAAITDEARMRANPPDGATPDTIHYDDDLFAAAMVAIGSMGILASVVLEVREQFGISEIGVTTTWRDIRPLLESGDIFTTTRYSISDPARRWIDLHPNTTDRRPRGLGLAINPYRTSDNYTADDSASDRQVRFFTHAESGKFVGDRNWPTVDKFEFWKMLMHFESGDLSGTRGAIGRFLELWSPLSGTEGRYLRSYTVWDPYPIWHDGQFPSENFFHTMEIVVSTLGARHVRCVDRILEICDDIHADTQIRRSGIKIAAGIFLRYTKPSFASLAMQSPIDHFDDNERFCHIEILVAKEIDLAHIMFGNVHAGHHNMENLSELFFQRFEDCAHEFDGRMHWGQLHHLNRLSVDRDYPRGAGRFRAALTRIGWEDGGAVFQNDATRRAGVASNAQSVAAVIEKGGSCHVFAVNGVGDVLHGRWRSGSALGWERIANGFSAGERFVGPLTATLTDSCRIDVFGTGTHGNLLQLTLEGLGTGGTRHWTDLRMTLGASLGLQGQLSAVSVEPGHIDVFGVAVNGDVRRFSLLNNNHWAALTIPNQLTGNRLIGSISAIVVTGNVRLFGLDRNGAITEIHERLDGTWAWDSIAFTPGHRPLFVGSPVAMNTGGSIDLFIPGRRRTLYLAQTAGSDGDNATKRTASSERIPGAFLHQLTVHATSYDFAANPLDDDLFQYPSSNVTEWFVGPIAGAVDAGIIHLFGFGERGTLLLMRNDPKTGWQFLDLETMPGQLPAVYVPPALVGPFSGRDLTNGFFRYSEAKGADFQNAVMNAIDLEGATLSGSNFTGVPFASAKLFGAKMDNSDAHGATLSHAELAHASAKACDFHGIHAPYADFSAAVLIGSNFVGADLSKATFRDSVCLAANFQGANLSAARMEGVWVDDANLTGTNLSSTYLARASGVRARFFGANLSSSVLAEGRFNAANFQGANLSAARMDRSRLDDVNLEGANLSAASLREVSGLRARFVGANLSLAVLIGGTFDGAMFLGANLSGARMDGARLDDANLEGATFSIFYGARASLADVSCIHASFYGVNLRSVALTRGTFAGANFYGATLTLADLSGTECSNASFYGANLRRANMMGGVFREAIFTGADLSLADLRNADLRFAMMMGADLSFADLRNADLRFALMMGADLQGANLDGALR